MGVSRRGKKEHKCAQADDGRKHCEDDSRLLVPVIVQLHDEEQNRHTQCSRHHLPQPEIVRVVELLRGDDSRRTKDHGDTEYDQTQRRDEKCVIGLKWFRHYRSNS